MRQLFIYLLAAAPLACPAQFMIKGMVRDSVSQEGLPGVNVAIAATGVSGITNGMGYFEIESKTATAEVTFSFIGLLTTTLRLNASAEATIFLAVDDEASSVSDHFVKASLNLGYFGDAKAAPIGFMVNMPVQSIGRLRLDLFPNFSYWNANNNRGTAVSISKHLPFGSVGALPDNLFVGYRSLAYQESGFHLKQIRGLIVNELRGRFAIDIGAAYSQREQTMCKGQKAKRIFQDGSASPRSSNTWVRATPVFTRASTTIGCMSFMKRVRFSRSESENDRPPCWSNISTMKRSPV